MSTDGRIPQEVLDDIISRLSIVDVIGRYVPLKRTGANYMGLCPFHNERTPSFSVSPSKQIYHCFGCGAGGNLFRFVMDIEHLSFPEAARRLAKEAGVTIPERTRTPEEEKAWRYKQRLYKWMALAESFYITQLAGPSGAVYRDYLTARGITQETIDAFGIGCCVPGWEGLFRFLIQRGATPEELVELGLVAKSTRGTGYYDRFRDRLMFPIRNASGYTIGFGGRILQEDAAPQKYLNSPETPLFQKSKVLYGLDQAKQGIRKADQILLVEGYMDVLACHQGGIPQAVAPMGTALTPEQVKQLLRYSYRFVTAFDGDEAGRRATLKSLDLIEGFGGQPRVMAFPEDSDPDTYIRIHGLNGFQLQLEAAQEGVDFRLEQALAENPEEGIEAKLSVLEALLPYLANLHNQAKTEHSVQKVAEALNLSQQAVWDELSHYRRSARRQSQPSPGVQREATTDAGRAEPPVKTQAFLREAALLNLLFINPEGFQEVEDRGGDTLFESPLNSLYREAAGHYLEQGTVCSGDISAQWSPLLAQVLSEWEDQADLDWADLFPRILDHIQWVSVSAHYQRKLADVSALESSGNIPALEEALLELGEILNKKTRLERDMRKEQ